MEKRSGVYGLGFERSGFCLFCKCSVKQSISCGVSGDRGPIFIPMLKKAAISGYKPSGLRYRHSWDILGKNNPNIADFWLNL
jgi:hypothetical protein